MQNPGRIGIAVLGFLAAFSACLGSWTSSWGAFGGDSFSAGVTRGDIRAIVRVLELDEVEAMVIETLHEAYAATVRDEGKAVRREAAELIEEAELMSDADSANKVQEIRSEWEERRTALEEEFLKELRLTLTREQEGRWALVERELRRIHELSSGRMQGEWVDVTRLVETKGVEVEGAVASALDGYAKDLDAALKKRASELERHPYEEAQGLIESDPSSAKRAYVQIRGARAAVRDVNLRAAREVSAAIGGEKGEEVWRGYLDQTLARIVNETVAERLLDGAKSVESLTPEQVRRLESIAEGFEADRWAWMERMREVVFEIEEGAMVPRLARALGEAETRIREDSETGMPARWVSGSPFADAWRDRLRIDRGVRRALEGLLTDAQWEELPVAIDRGISFRGGVLYNVGGANSDPVDW